MVPLTPLSALNALKEADSARTVLIEGNKNAFKHIDEEAKEKKEDLRKKHRDANKTLVEAVRAAQACGINVEDSCATIGKSPQAIYRIEQEVRKHESRPENTEPER